MTPRQHYRDLWKARTIIERKALPSPFGHRQFIGGGHLEKRPGVRNG